MTVTQRKRKHSPHQPVGRWIRVDKRLAIYLRDQFTCHLCKKDLHGANPRDITLDHYVPKAEGGSNDESNVFTCCAMCNSTRQTTPLKAVQRKRVTLVLKTDLASYRALAKALMHDDYMKHFSRVQKHARKAA